MSSGHKDKDGKTGLNTENGNGEAQASDWDIECQSLRLPVDGGQRPGDTNTQEHVHGVGSSHVSDGVIGGFVLNSGGLGGEGIRHRGSQSDEGDGVDAILEIDEATEMTGDVSNDGGTDTNGSDGDDEGGVSVEDSGWWDDSEEEFPWKVRKCMM